MAKAQISSTAVTAVVVVGGGLLLYSLYLTNQGLKEVNRGVEWWAGGFEQAKSDIGNIPSGIVGGIQQGLGGAGEQIRKPFVYIQDKSLATMEGGKELIAGDSDRSPWKKDEGSYLWGWGPKK